MVFRVRACAIVLGAMLASVLIAARAPAQTAPAGNAHPHEAMKSGDGAPANPFGPSAPSPFDAAGKHGFARGLDLSPLRDLAVFHDGRVKILDTLARETVRKITGRKDYFDAGPGKGFMGGPEKWSYEPLFTFLDLIIDPSYYDRRPLMAVNYLPLREAMLEAAGIDAGEQERYKRLGRLTPSDVERTLAPAAQRLGASQPMQQALDEVLTARMLVKASASTLDMLAPDSADKPWRHLSESGSGTVVSEACAAIGNAWRAGDAAAVNAAVRTLAAELPRINPSYYPTGKRTLERLYNASNAFEYGFWIYALALVSLLLAFGTGRGWLLGTGLTLLTGGIGLHAFGFVSRCVIAERLAIQNQFESMTGLSLAAVLVGSAIMLVRRQVIFGAAAAAVGFLVLIAATQAKIPGVSIEREAAILNTSVLLKYHVTTVLSSYGLISLGFVVSLFYLGTYYAVGGTRPASRAQVALPSGGGAVEVSAAALGVGGEGSGEPGARSGVSRVLGDLDTAQMIVLQLAFWTLGVGILLGAWWADHSWGRWWAFDPKELWALITWIVYLIVIHVRFVTGSRRAILTAWLSVIGFFVMLWTYFGVNLMLPGLHAYA
ncbi:MAG: cytochrome c biogenesis protein CcsA [Phycisphaerae bacterium]|nr:cytochrome c biogenesis protein CcsA [Phycisphaerae bacterium]